MRRPLWEGLPIRVRRRVEDENLLTAAGMVGWVEGWVVGRAQDCLNVGGWLTGGQDRIQVEENEKSHKKVLFIQWTQIHPGRRVCSVGSISPTDRKIGVQLLITSKGVENIVTPQFEGRNSICQSISR